MKKFVKKILFFLLFFLLFSVILNSAFLAIIMYSDWDYVKRRESLNFDNPDFKLLVIGSSLAEYGIDAELLSDQGIKSFNLSFVGSSIKTYYVQLNEYLTKYCNKPKFVLIAVNSYSERFDQEGIQPVVEFTMKDHKYGIKDIPISKFRWAGMEIIKKVLKRGYKNIYVSYGQKRAKGMDPDTSNYQEIYLNIEKYESAFWLGEIAKLCNQHGIELIVVDIPGVKESQNLSEVGPYKLLYNKEDSALLYNYNNQDFCKIIDENKDWCGRSHFNKFGAAKFTNELVKILKE